MGDEYVTNEEVYLTLSQVMQPEHIEGVQKIGGLWRLYIPDHEARCQLLAEGLNLRGKTINITKYNPFSRDPNTITVRVCDVPLIVQDLTILTNLRDIGAVIVGDCIKERLRVGGKLVNCLTGNRRIDVKLPKQPLPRYISIKSMVSRPRYTIVGNLTHMM